MRYLGDGSHTGLHAGQEKTPPDRVRRGGVRGPRARLLALAV
jgi:hypothetical protein